MELQQLVLNHRRVHLRTWGDRGPLVVLLHGITDTGGRFEHFASRLQDRYRLVAPDFRGHGWSEHRGPYRVHDYAADILALVASLNGPWLCYGHSLGALVSLFIASHEPTDLVGVVAEDPPLFEVFESPSRPMPADSGFRLQHAVRAQALNHGDVLQGLMQAYPDDPYAAQIRRADRLWRCDPDIWSPLFDGSLIRPWQPSTIACPVDFLQGDPAHGGVLDDASLAQMAPFCLAMQSTFFPGCGHSVLGIEADAVVQRIHAMFS